MSSVDTPALNRSRETPASTQSGYVMLLVSLPRGAMPLDFAYAVHTNVGDTTIGAKINGELKLLRTPLNNGDVVQIIRGEKPAVPPDWRSLTITGRARSRSPRE